MFAEVMEIVAGCRPESRVAVLTGFRRGRLRGRLYPGLVRDAAAQTHGVLWEGLESTELARLDRFEGALYERQRCEVVLGSGERRAAFVYVLAPTPQRALLLELDWDEADFRARHLTGYLADCRAFARDLEGGPSTPREQVQDE